jgi:hypothetical protein
MTAEERIAELEAENIRLRKTPGSLAGSRDLRLPRMMEFDKLSRAETDIAE